MNRFNIPRQTIALGLLFGILVVVFLAGRALFVPRSFGLYGHYRGDAIKDNESLAIQFAGSTACADCHADIFDLKAGSFHANVACEVCHGAAADHIADPGKMKQSAPRERGLCPLCHNYNPARPTGFPQIITDRHNPGKPCMKCHNPHDPKPPSVPAGCNECHRAIANQLAVSPHAALDCTICHDVPETHKISPRQNRPGKPNNNNFCGRCHAKPADTSTNAPPAAELIPTHRVEIKTHAGRYLCWECHYPHHPEAGP
ncbi:MAG: hypothetical protein HYV35_10490 [Lentisphaerae bacterium]|nr:hypothetical protein [Lentisphaerota bacterium]